jgi:hypothetical protein
MNATIIARIIARIAKQQAVQSQPEPEFTLTARERAIEMRNKIIEESVERLTPEAREIIVRLYQPGSVGINPQQTGRAYMS